ncbi:MAG: hypothetical protein AL399_08495 [Candidatus [Bacteroides] periocalifornicus]|uniref:Uncharacterized protein n=1 Tax=Candidatus [Bacteroides] periocalifornicus TaxID=1702214 RepID=A0A0Q4B5E4_9BACT|nr:MAG: hypothetical protein AL399_08495 [Candidatus [Bacteroides] periocalifornicus]
MRREEVEAHIRMLREKAKGRLEDTLNRGDAAPDAAAVARSRAELEEAYQLAQSHGLELECYVLRYDLLELRVRMGGIEPREAIEGFFQLAQDLDARGVGVLGKLHFASLWWCHILTVGGGRDLAPSEAREDARYLQLALAVAERDSRLKTERIVAAGVLALHKSRWESYEYRPELLTTLAWVVDAVLGEEERNEELAQIAYRCAREYAAVELAQIGPFFQQEQPDDAPWATDPRAVERLSKSASILQKAATIARSRRDAATYIKLQLYAGECLESIPEMRARARSIFQACRDAVAKSAQLEIYTFGLKAGWLMQKLEYVKDRRQGTGGITSLPTDYARCIVILEETLKLFDPQTDDVTPEVAESYPLYVEARAKLHTELAALYQREEVASTDEALENGRRGYLLFGLLCAVNLTEYLGHCLEAAGEYCNLLAREGNYLERYQIAQRCLRLVAQALHDVGTLPDSTLKGTRSLRGGIALLYHKHPVRDADSYKLHMLIERLVEEVDNVFNPTGDRMLTLEWVEEDIQYALQIAKDGNAGKVCCLLPDLIRRANQLPESFSTHDSEECKRILSAWECLRELLVLCQRPQEAIAVCERQTEFLTALYNAHPEEHGALYAPIMAILLLNLVELHIWLKQWASVHRRAKLAKRKIQQVLKDAGQQNEGRRQGYSLMLRYHKVMAIACRIRGLRISTFHHIWAELPYCKKCYEMTNGAFLPVLAENYVQIHHFLERVHPLWKPSRRRWLAFYSDAIPMVETYSQGEGNGKYVEDLTAMRRRWALLLFNCKDYGAAGPALADSLTRLGSVGALQPDQYTTALKMASALVVCAAKGRPDFARQALQVLTALQTVYPKPRQVIRYLRKAQRLLANPKP